MALVDKTKLKQAESIVLKCIGKRGVWASPTRYKYQCWTRDFVIALPVLLEMNKHNIVRSHLESIAKRQFPNGEVPILFADSTLKLFFKKVRRAMEKRQFSFVLKRLIWPGLARLSVWTRDVEILFIIGTLEYIRSTNDQVFYKKYKSNILIAMEYVEQHLLRDGLMLGADWRDMLERELQDKVLLSNNAFLYHAYCLLKQDEKAETLKNKINQVFWNGKYYKDYPDSKNFDVFGQSLAILFDIVPPERYKTILQRYLYIDMPFGFKINDIFPKPTSQKEKKIIQHIINTTNQYSVIWPFVNGFAILALIKMERDDIAKEQFEKWNKLDGFYEWYDPKTGKGYGSSQQLWSAALYLRVAQAIQKII